MPRKDRKSKAAQVSSKPASIPKASPFWHPLLAVFALAFLVYANTLGHGYALDDAIVITENDYTQQGFAGMGEIFTTDAFKGYFGESKNLVSGGRYRPLSVATFAAEVEFFGNSPSLSHFFNIVLYGLSCVLIYLLLMRLFPSDKEKPWYFSNAFLISALYTLHPLHTEVVANLKGRDEILALLFGILTCLWVLDYLQKQKPLYLILSAASFFLALLAKESVIPFLFIIPFTAWFFKKGELKDILIASAPIFASFGLYLFMRFTFVGGIATVETAEVLNAPFLGASEMERLATVFHTLGKYLSLQIFPHPLTHDYYFNQIPIIGWGNIQAIGPLLIYLLLGVFAVLGIKRRNPAAYGIIFYIATLSIVSNIVLDIGTTMGERFLFIPSLGFCIALVWVLNGAIERFAKKDAAYSRPLLIVCGIFAVGFAAKTILRNPVWENNFSLFTTDVYNSPNSAKARTSAGGVLVDQVDKEKNPSKKSKYLRTAVEHLNEAVRIYPEHGQAWLLLGNAWFKLDQNSPQAITAYEKALTYRPLLVDAWNNLGVVSGKQKQHGKAISAFKKVATDFRPKDPKVWFDIGINYEEWGKIDSAVYAFSQTIAIDPEFGRGYGKLGLIYGRNLQQFDTAIQYLQKAIELNPNDESYYENLGIAQAMKGNTQGAIAAFNQGLSRFPGSAKLNQNMGITYLNIGDTVTAQQYFNKTK